VDGIKYAFTVELRGNSTFTPPDTEIQPSYEEFWNGLVAMVDKIEEKNGP
jgi:chloramphenicol O-acetyltransferase